ncbi:hypothetical protein NLI96_g2557 [Meripilus lineatus]|uniref:Uncharacterized protein n=1 Tax=Meripilus lineatus TaxID=2056292 RepID=A0AAD5V9W3_9APHY|nr:hypothetical protein NLI96_g2557 [Physisporinus lineatus]
MTVQAIEPFAPTVFVLVVTGHQAFVAFTARRAESKACRSFEPEVFGPLRIHPPPPPRCQPHVTLPQKALMFGFLSFIPFLSLQSSCSAPCFQLPPYLYKGRLKSYGI